MTHQYGKRLGGAYLGAQPVFPDDTSAGGDWKATEPEAAATLWRYMTFAKFYSLLERAELFFALVGDMADKYEGFISPRLRQPSGLLENAERITPA